MTQDGLINNIINTRDIKGCHHSATCKDVQSPLRKDVMKMPTQYKYQLKYSSLIIIMMYVTKNSYQNIVLSVHQCAKTNHNPKHSHEK